MSPGEYTLQNFEVYSEDETLIWLSPTNDSPYARLWEINGVEKKFTVDAFKKLKVNIDVLCWAPGKWEAFGFAWINFNKIVVKTICFSGEFYTRLCKYLPTFYHTIEGSPYVNQEYHGEIFPAIYKVLIKNEEGEVMNALSENSNLDYSDLKNKLCVHYPDYLNKDDKYTVEVYLANPDNTWPLLYKSQPFDADDHSEITGSDGVFYFSIGENLANKRLDRSFDLPICPQMQFESKNIVLRNLYFFGDVCTPNYEEWGHKQYDFVADLKVTISDKSEGANNKIINTAYSSDLEKAGPVCIKYPDYKNRDDEKYWVDMHIKDPSGAWVLIDGRALNPNEESSLFYGNDIEGNIDTDGIFDFVYYEGENCNYRSNTGVNLLKEM